jgi:hypothetical protein
MAKDAPVTLPGDLFLAGDQAWSVALERFDQGNRILLAQLVAAYLRDPKLVAYNTESPTEQEILALADIIGGARKPDARGLKRRKWSPGQRQLALWTLEHLREQRDAALRDTRRIEATAEHRGIEVADVIAWLHQQYRQKVKELAAQYGVSVRRLEDAAKPSAQKN